MSSFFSYYWRLFFPLPQSQTTLGQELIKARTSQELSVKKVAEALHLSEDIILELESNRFSRHSLFQEGYSRLIAVRYARFLGMELSVIHSLLPPVAPLHYPERTLVKNLSHLHQKPQRSSFKKIEKLTYSVSGNLMSLFKIVGVIIGIIFLFYLWNMVRYLGRVLF